MNMDMRCLFTSYIYIQFMKAFARLKCMCKFVPEATQFLITIGKVASVIW